MGIMSIVSLALGALLLIGFLLGFWRSWRKSLIRFGFIVLSFIAALLLSSKISKILMSKYVSGLVISLFGMSIDFEELAGEFAGDLLGEGSAITSFATALMNIAIKLISFLIIFVSFMIVTLIIYWIISLSMNSKRKKNSVGEAKERIWERFIGSGISLISTLVMCMVLFTPVFGVMNVCDKFLKDDKKASASAYNETTFVAGKFYTENENIGKVESYLEKYDKLRKDYKKSFAGVVLTYTGVDAVGKTVFNSITTVEQDGIKVNFTDECVNIVNVYNIYKENFVENKFDLATEKSVTALEDIYLISRNSEVLRTFIVDLVPKMSNKWANGEKFLNMELPATGDTKEIVVDLLGVFGTKDFVVLDRNIDVLFEAIKIANTHDVISSVNTGTELMDVIDRDGFVKDEIKTLSITPEFKRALPNVMTTMVKLAYKSALEDPGTKLDQEFTQEKLASIVWDNEADVTQTIISRMFKFFDTEDVIDNLTDFGVVIDSARKSAVLSKPVKILMNDYIETKVDGLGGSKQTILNSINDNWDSPDYCYTDLFATVEVTAKIAKDSDSMQMTDMKDSIKNLIENDTSGEVKATIKEAVNNGALDSLVGDANKAGVYKDILFEIIDETDSSTIDQDLQAGQVIADIINNPKTGETSMLDNYSGETDEEKAEVVIETLVSSETVMNVLTDEANKVDGGHNSDVKNYIDNLSDSDKSALSSALSQYDSTNPKIQTLSKLFGN